MLVHEYAHALMERGYITLEMPYDDSDVSDSESEDPAEETDLSDVDSDELEDAGCNFSAGPDDTDDAEDPTNVLDDLISQHDWQASSAAVLKRLGLEFNALENWLETQKKSGAKPATSGTGTSEQLDPNQLLIAANMNQRGVYDFVTGHVASGEIFFLVLQGPAGCGKYFLYVQVLETRL